MQIDRLNQASEKLAASRGFAEYYENHAARETLERFGEWVSLILDEQTTDEDTPRVEVLVVAFEAGVSEFCGE